MQDGGKAKAYKYVTPPADKENINCVILIPPHTHTLHSHTIRQQARGYQTWASTKYCNDIRNYIMTNT